MKDIVKEIKYKTGKTVGEIAAQIGYSRPYFTDQVNKGENDILLDLLRKTFPEIEHNVPFSNTELSQNSTDSAYLNMLLRSLEQRIDDQKQKSPDVDTSRQ